MGAGAAGRQVNAKAALSYLGLCFAVVVWGASFVAARAVLAGEGTTLTPIMLAALRFGLATAVLLPLALVGLSRGGGLRVRDIPVLFLLGQLGISIYFWLQYTGVQLTNAGIAAILVVGLIPTATAIAAQFVLNERLTGPRALGMALGAAGVAVVAMQRDAQVALESGFLLGVACLVANAFCFALYSSAIRRLRARLSSLILTGLVTAWGTLGLLGMAVVDGSWSRVAALSAGQWWAVAFLALACSVVGYFAYNHALAHLEASKAVTWLYLEPVVAVVLGVVLLAEQFTVPTALGGLLIAGSVVLVQRT